jgi:hypothetical protein
MPLAGTLYTSCSPSSSNSFPIWVDPYLWGPSPT